MSKTLKWFILLVSISIVFSYAPPQKGESQPFFRQALTRQEDSKTMLELIKRMSDYKKQSELSNARMELKLEGAIQQLSQLVSLK